VLYYLVRRLLLAVPSLLGISIVLFGILALAPGDPFSDLASDPSIPPSVAAGLRAKFGLDDPTYLRYFHWLAAMLRGDWGFSFASRIDVSRLILQRLPTTLAVIGASQVLALLIALPVGVYAGVRPYSFFDQVASSLALVGFSLPTFFTGLVLILVFSVNLHWLPFVYRSDISGSGLPLVWAYIRQAIMPVAVLGLFQGAAWTRFVRASWPGSITLPRRAPRGSASAWSSASTSCATR
jgi:peptide/nickel transport system permease protein